MHRPPDATTRRRVLATAGLAAGAAALPAAPAHAAAAARPPLVHTGVRALLDRGGDKLADGDTALLTGYREPGDGGGMLLRWDPRSSAPPNGGTVLAPANTRRGRWLRVHEGVLDFRSFGHFDAAHPADDALDAMLADPAVHRIEAHTDLLLRRRHRIHRSRITLDFGGHTVHTTGIERGSHDDPFGAVLSFSGTRTSTTLTHALAAPVPELTDTYPVPDSGAFRVGQWWALAVDPVAGGGRDERELQKLVEITEIVDPTHVRVGYLSGWELAAGRRLTWTRVEPVREAHVRALRFEGAGADEYTGSHPVAYEYAVDCDVHAIHAVGTFWPVIMRRWCTRFRTENCSLKNPPTVEYGGAGYLTQNIYCLYGRIADCTTSNVRHLSDLTASAYCLVENCHGDGDDAGGNPFTTHGQYEHDLLFDGNSGLMDLANSGAQWGTSAKRITVRKHVCSWFTANTRITDLTLEDVRVIARPTFDRAGTLTVNADGAQVRGCTAKTFSLTQRSTRSRRPTVVSDCAFAAPPDTVLIQSAVTTPVHFVRCELTGLDGAALRGTGPVRLTDCRLAAAEHGAPLTVAAAELRVHGGRLEGLGLRLTAERDQQLRITGGTALTGTPAGGAFLSRAASEATVVWDLSDLTATTTASGTAHARIDHGANHWSATGCRFTGGTLHLAPDALRSALHSTCVEDGTRRTAFPQPGDTAQITGNLLL
ncbi:MULTISPECIES: peptidase C14 [Streptomyces]|uniref:peptidase C14 n=1 Tax=Streptomyces TaxID=1883 RepID=UPI000B9E8913|nr:peptidase C14 [Streptomyces kasugaensis]